MDVAPGAASVADCSVRICCHLPVAAFHQVFPVVLRIATSTLATPVSSPAVPVTATVPPGFGTVEPSTGLVTAAAGAALGPPGSPKA